MSTNIREIERRLGPPELSSQPITRKILAMKYCVGKEATAEDVQYRVARGLAKAEKPQLVDEIVARIYEAQVDGLTFAGRINAAAGTKRRTTLSNCFVEPIGDSIAGIFNALLESAETMSRGGGEGYDASPIRPKGALVKGKESIASGPISYAKVFDAMCDTVSSAGNRRGAQMLVLRVDHPDIEEFITAKSEQGVLTKFNISVNVTDSFIEALSTGRPFELLHKAEPGDELKANGAYQRDDGLWVYKTIDPRKLWHTIMRQTYDYAEPGILLLDNANRENNLWYCETLAATNPCGEQPLPPYGCCCLGSVNLTKFVRDPFTDNATFDFEAFSRVVAVGTRALDNVLDVTYWPLEEQHQEAMNKRRTGLGFTGLGNALTMLKLRYDSDEGRAMAERIAKAEMEAAYWASVALAKEKGAFPLFDADKYLQSGFAKRLPKDLRAAIRMHGIRNSHLLSIAPTGTISLAFADNASNGIEPAFSWYYNRVMKEEGDVEKTYRVVDHAFRRYCVDTHGIDPANLSESISGSTVQICDVVIDEEEFDDRIGFENEVMQTLTRFLPDYFVSALDMSADDHLKMLAVVQPYIDSSISKTVNVPENYPFERFEDLYQKAIDAGLKGLATFRPSEVRGAVLSVDSSDKSGAEVGELTFGQSDVDRRLTIDTHPEPVMGSLRWPKRPKLLNGNPSWTFMVKTEKHSFAIFVGHTENGTNHPFEVWTNGSEQPRGLGAIAKALSMDMRSNDRAFLMAKLDSLERSKGPTVIEHAMPPDGRPVMVSSLESLFAKIVKHRILELEAIPPRNSDGEKGQTDLVGTALTPMMDALMSPREPKTSDGTMAWCVDVRNHATGDDFVLMVKELMMPDGQRRPFSVWMSGEYPSVFNGLCKVLSFDMRILDPAWVGKKLRSLLDFAEPGGDFMAPVPGSKKSATFPSTVAYVSRLLIHRYAMHGILSEDGFPITEAGLMDEEYQNVVGLRNSRSASERGKGLLCPSCSTYHLWKIDGCARCTECGYDAGCG